MTTNLGATPMRWEPLPFADSHCRRLPNYDPHLVPEISIWGHDEFGLIAGRADALAIIETRVDAATD
ncbi:hypothetical protein KEU06_01555 [Pseudaminobacter sp. 19-2017]|uniref:Uncharacterized protein n=1 Tax=Pseudaminobacter soli (ex Zhang et al. 2022) TaxID=2831468 RepID=A0A942DV40_9HYPH|nr:hypothetical protein [Pseudaminobacter soli]MBS3647309.1 hypothetical protein [Pseudaminobacter soli]